MSYSNFHLYVSVFLVTSHFLQRQISPQRRVHFLNLRQTLISALWMNLKGFVVAKLLHLIPLLDRQAEVMKL